MEEKWEKFFGHQKLRLDALSHEARTWFRLAYPLLGGTATYLAIWVFAITQLIQNDIDKKTQHAQELYKELVGIQLMRFLSEKKQFEIALQELFGNEYYQEYERVTYVLSKGHEELGEFDEEDYPPYVEKAAEWWLKNNIADLSSVQEKRFYNRMKRKINSQIQDAKVSLIATYRDKTRKTQKLQLKIGGLEEYVLYPQYMAMIATEKEVEVQEGTSRWTKIWEAEES